ncbi:MAG: hypothetical protein RI885_1142 [Actinomycetota bacterium]|jgi:hypothetical protein
MPMNPFSGLQDVVDQLPELLQPILVFLVGAVPFIDEAAAGLGVVAGVHPLIAFTANVAGSTVAVVLVVSLGSRVREAIVRRRARRSTPVPSRQLASVASAGAGQIPDTSPSETPQHHGAKKEKSKGEKRLAAWMVRFGVPGASLLAPVALPFALTSLFFVGAGVNKSWVILWQVIAIVLWTALVTVSATAAVAVLGG